MRIRRLEAQFQEQISRNEKDRPSFNSRIETLLPQLRKKDQNRCTMSQLGMPQSSQALRKVSVQSDLNCSFDTFSINGSFLRGRQKAVNPYLIRNT